MQHSTYIEYFLRSFYYNTLAPVMSAENYGKLIAHIAEKLVSERIASTACGTGFKCKFTLIYPCKALPQKFLLLLLKYKFSNNL